MPGIPTCSGGVQKTLDHIEHATSTGQRPLWRDMRSEPALAPAHARPPTRLNNCGCAADVLCLARCRTCGGNIEGGRHERDRFPVCDRAVDRWCGARGTGCRADTKSARGTVTAVGGDSITVRVAERELKFSVDPRPCSPPAAPALPSGKPTRPASPGRVSPISSRPATPWRSPIRRPAVPCARQTSGA